MPKLGKPRKRRSIRVRLDLCRWVEKQIGKGKFQSFSHAIEVALQELKDTE